MESLIQSLLLGKEAGDYDISYLSINSNKWSYLKRLCKVFFYYYIITVKMSAQLYLMMYNVLLLYVIL